MIQCDAFQPNAFQNDCVGEVLFQCDAFQLDAFQNDCEDLPEDLTTRRRRQTVVVLLPPGERVRVTTPLEEWKREREPSMEALAQALQEDEDLLLGLWD